MSLLSNTYFALFLIIAIGFIIGRIKIRGLSLDSSAIIFVALVFGHYGITIPADFQYLGLVLFIFTIGIQAGPGFFDSFKTEGRILSTLATVLVISAAFIALLSIYIFHIDKNIAIGLLTGSLTSTPGLAAAIDYTGSPLASIGYGVAYPMGVVGVILFIRFIPFILNKPIKSAEEELESKTKEAFPEILKKNFVVENENINGKSIGELRIRYITNAVISRIVKDGHALTPTPQTILNHGDLIKAVGTAEALESIKLLIGNETEEEIGLDPEYDVNTVLVTNKEVVNMTIAQINLLNTYNATITRIRRSGIDISPTPDLKLRFGDKLVIACSKAHMLMVSRIFGNDDKKLSDTDILPIATGIILGILIGRVSINFGSFTFSLGLTGGILLFALIISRIGKTGPVIWTMSGAANQLLRQLGLILFLAAVGTSAGEHIAETFHNYGISLFLIGTVITILPMIITAFIGKWIYKMNILRLMGAITGSMTSTPGLAAADSMTRSNAPAIAYATVYPVAMVLLIIVVQVLAILI
ncbi:MAG: transporter [Prolixibacteraceae bacterium]|nr:transporter [Prolixibacteraceae bacterium]MBN2775016.1 transporter [Prolixibacteraceae bacterium]